MSSGDQLPREVAAIRQVLETLRSVSSTLEGLALLLASRDAEWAPRKTGICAQGMKEVPAEGAVGRPLVVPVGLDPQYLEDEVQGEPRPIRKKCSLSALQGALGDERERVSKSAQKQKVAVPGPA